MIANVMHIIILHADLTFFNYFYFGLLLSANNNNYLTNAHTYQNQTFHKQQSSDNSKHSGKENVSCNSSSNNTSAANSPLHHQTDTPINDDHDHDDVELESEDDDDVTEDSRSSSSPVDIPPVNGDQGGRILCSPTEYILGSPISSTTSNSQYEDDDIDDNEDRSDTEDDDTDNVDDGDDDNDDDYLVVENNAREVGCKII